MSAAWLFDQRLAIAARGGHVGDLDTKSEVSLRGNVSGRR